MLAQSRYHKQAQRGIVLVLVLAMLGLLALIGVTFATFSGQAKINAKIFYQGVITAQDDELMDFALSQLITDSCDAKSAIHGHSLARDMYGADGSNNGYFPYHPTLGTPFYITSAPVASGLGTYTIQTNIQSNDPNFYGYTTFMNWIVRISYQGTRVKPSVLDAFGQQQTLAANAPVYQTFQVTGDTGFISTSSALRVLKIAVLDPSAVSSTSITGQTYGGTSTSLINWTQWAASQLPSAYLAAAANNNSAPVAALPFSLDGRWLRTFNGAGMTGDAAMGNFRYNGLNSTYLGNSSTTVGMDEDYDACDLENWFLALQSADGQVIIPSFHRPGIIRYDLLNGVNDWQRQNIDNGADQPPKFSSSASRILRPCYADGHDPTTFPDLKPDLTSGKIARFVGTTEVGTGYDVDNDGDGVSDSVWLDLGYPSRRDSRGQLYKPLFAFMVIGLNGRIPLNTAGNLAGQSSNTTGNNALSPNYSHTEHLGNSISEIDPTYALQNAFVPGTDFDPFNQLGNGLLPANYPVTGVNNSNAWGPNTGTYNSQVDNALNLTTLVYAPQDVRLTQLRNLLAGTRPQANPQATPNLTANGDANLVYGQWTGTNYGQPYYMPNGIVDGADQSSTYSYTDNQGTVHPLVARTTAPVGGRWGEAASIPGVPFYLPNNSTPYNLVQSNYANPIRAGYSFDVTNLITAFGGAYDANGDPIYPRDAADDNYNAFDVFPPRLTGEVGDLDFYDGAGGLLLPVERMRRFVTPVDINGSGRVHQFTDTVSSGIIRRGSNLGPDNYGRVQFSSYFRPAGSPGVISTQYVYDAPAFNPVGGPLGAIYYPTGASGDPFYTSGPNPFVNYLTPYPYGTSATAPVPTEITYPAYLPDLTNNPYHGFESNKVPNLFQNPGWSITSTQTNPASTPSVSYPSFQPTSLGGMPVNGPNNLTASIAETKLGATASTLPTPIPPATTIPFPGLPFVYQTYDNQVNSSGRLDGVNEADKMNLYSPNPLLDSPFGPSDLEWLYRQQDIDGATLTSRLAQLAPISFTNTLDGLRRRRLFALDSWDSNHFIWANDNPGGFFANNASFVVGASPSFRTLGTTNHSGAQPTPTLAQRDRKINLNFPLPVSNDCNEPIRQKWISDTYQLLKAILPPDGVDTAEELAQLSQFVINIIDFRDPDGTMTHWINPDVIFTPSISTSLYPTLTLSVGSGNLDQYGMEYNPVAINEVLAYSFQSLTVPSSRSAVVQSSRFCVELVNTLTAAYNPNYDYGNEINPINYYANQASTLNLGGFNYVAPEGTTSDPYAAGCWDLVVTADDGMSRPDPYRGELSAYTPTGGILNYYSLIPLTRDSFFPVGTTAPTNTPNSGDVSLLPINANPPGNANTPNVTPAYLPSTNPPTSTGGLPAPTGGMPVTYFYVIANPTSGYEQNAISMSNPSTQYPAVTQTLLTPYDPMPLATTTFNAQGTPTPPIPLPGPTINWRLGILPGVIANPTGNKAPTNFQWKIPSLGVPAGLTGNNVAGNAKFYWVCLRRPANPFAAVSATNPMCVVDSMRFPYVDGTASTWTLVNGSWNVSGSANTIYSAQRLQPYRGGHAVPLPALTGTGTTSTPPDPRYGYTEQICPPTLNTSAKTYGLLNKTTGFPATPYIQYHTLGQANNSAENWDYLVFNDRDFSSVAELMLVPGCPPGLFTKQFVEFAPSQINVANIFSSVTPALTPTFATSTITLTNNVPALGNSGTNGGRPVNSFATATVPFFSVSKATLFPTAVTSTTYTAPTGITAVPSISPTATQPNSIPVPIQPHSFPYLVDKFFYTGASTFYYPPTGIATDPSVNKQYVVGGPGADGWFKMFDFFEVPSQANGSIGPVIAGNNFDWARQDIKPGLMNPNLIIDEEAFFAVFGRQNSSFTQTLLNGIQLPPWPSQPYTMPLTGNAANGTAIAPIPFGWSPFPLVVSALQANGAPNFVYPVVAQPYSVSSGSPVPQGYMATDPIQTLINNNLGMTPTPPGARGWLKAAFAQFLWLRHGGSGYLFGHGSGLSTIQLPGQNSSVLTVNGGTQLNTLPIPSDRPFRSLSFPDINYTIMRPAALPPSTYSNPVALSNNAASNASPLYNTTLTPNPPRAGQTPTFFLTQAYYAPYVANTNFPTAGPIVYTGDPGVRNPFLSQGYATSNSAVMPAYTVTATTPAGVPIPINVAWPGATTPITDVMVLPPPIPPARLFQAPDAYGAGGMTIYGYNYYGPANDYEEVFTLPPPVSNASDSGDPWINNQVPYPPTQVVPTTGTFALNNGFPSLIWPWMSAGNTSTPPTTIAGSEFGVGSLIPSPPNPATGVLPLVVLANPAGVTTQLTFGSSTPYLGSYSGLQTTSPTGTDDRQHPFWRTEQLQKAMNLTTVRTHQYAVWITIGFFEVKRTGDIGMLGQGLPQLAFDTLGPEVGALTGNNVRYRGFFLVDRLKLTGFNPGAVGSFRAAVVYRKVIQ